MRKRLWAIGAFVVVVAAVVLLLVFLPGEASPAIVVEIENVVDASPHPRQAWQPAVVDQEIYGGGQVRTGGASSARLQLPEGTVRLSAETLFTVIKSVSRRNALETIVSLPEGRLWAHLAADRPHAFTVQTGSAVAAVRDTRFSVRVSGGGTLLSVAEGEATLTAQDQSVTVRAGQQATAQAGQPPRVPVPLSDEERTLWATEGEMPHLAPPTPTPRPTSTPPPVQMSGDVSCALNGPAGDPSSRDPWTFLEVYVYGEGVAQVFVDLPDGRRIPLPSYGDVFGQRARFASSIQGMPRPGQTYTFTGLDRGGAPVPGAVAQDIYLGGYEPAPPSRVRAKLTDAGLLVTWDPSPPIPGSFEPQRTPALGSYQIVLGREGGEMVYGWNHWDRPLAETAHLIPLRRADFAEGDQGQALEELEDGSYFVFVSAIGIAPEGSAGRGNECGASDPSQNVYFTVSGGRIRVETK